MEIKNLLTRAYSEPKILLEERLKQLRKCNGFTQQQLAQMLGIDRSSYSYYEMGKTRPSIKILIKLSCIFHVSIDYLVGNIPYAR